MLLQILFLTHFLVGNSAQTLTLEITNFKHSNGTLVIGVFDSKSNFKDGEKPTYYKFVPITKADNLNVAFELAQGRYAVALYQDLNENRILDKNRLGIPKEPYGFSNNFRPKFSAPKFEDCAIELGGLPKTIHIKMAN